MGVSHRKSMHGFSQNFQDMFNTRVSRADYDLGSIWLPCQHFYIGCGYSLLRLAIVFFPQSEKFTVANQPLDIANWS